MSKTRTELHLTCCDCPHVNIVIASRDGADVAHFACGADEAEKIGREILELAAEARHATDPLSQAPGGGGADRRGTGTGSGGMNSLPIDVDEIERRQCTSPDGDSLSLALSVLSTCPVNRVTKSSKPFDVGLNHGAAARPQFSTVTGAPATMQAIMALLARAQASVVSAIVSLSSSLRAIARLLSRKTTASDESGPAGKDGTA